VQGRDGLRRLNDCDYNDDNDDDDDNLSNWRDLYHSSPATATAKRGLDIRLSICRLLLICIHRETVATQKKITQYKHKYKQNESSEQAFHK